MRIIEVDSLSKSFGSKRVLQGITFHVEEGEIFGFLGPNGAGKTTTIKILTTLIPPSGGSTRVLGHDIVQTKRSEIRKRIGVVQQQESYEINLSVEKALDLYGLLWDVPKKERRSLIDQLLERFGLKEERKVASSDLSIGLRRRLQVAREFMHEMDLLFLDEPTLGLDPIARRAALDFFRERARGGLTIFFTTHMLEEAEYLCDRIALINDGRIIIVDTPKNIKRRFGKSKTVELKVKQTFPDEFKLSLQLGEEVERITFRDDRTAAMITTHPEETISHILKTSEKLGLDISSIYVAEPSLEEVFVSLLKEDEK